MGINEIKRCNNIQTDITFHALKTLKIPVIHNSLLIDLQEAQEQNAEQPIRTHSPQSDQSSTTTPIGKILRKNDKELQKIMNTKDIRENALDKVMGNIQNGFSPPLLPPIDRERFSPVESGSDSVLCNWKVML